MSRFIRALTIALFALPVIFIASGLAGRAPLLAPGVLLAVAYLWVWLRMRPSRFVVHANAIEVIWPLRRRRVARASIQAARVIDTAELRSMVGACARVGAGGLWGGFGWLWTQHRGIVQMYVSRSDGMVWIERGAERPWLVTPESPEAFVRALGDTA
ncbi:MAG: PH domain-containing protein [Burkholderiales bacterium]|nr:PH domain-containing protein [Burkholderiales bacterium]